MKKLLWLILTIAVITIYWKFFLTEESVKLGPGVMVKEVPQQIAIAHGQSFEFKDYQLTPLASFAINAKVLAKKTYKSGRESDLSPIDLALGWKNMSDEAVLNKIEITQSNRWYRWRVQEFPIPRSEIETQSANMHLIPATKDVHAMINQVKQGEVIEMQGYLVRVNAKDGWHWQSSLTRNDTGAHACELVFVEKLTVLANKPILN